VEGEDVLSEGGGSGEEGEDQVRRKRGAMDA